MIIYINNSLNSSKLHCNYFEYESLVSMHRFTRWLSVCVELFSNIKSLGHECWIFCPWAWFGDIFIGLIHLYFWITTSIMFNSVMETRYSAGSYDGGMIHAFLSITYPSKIIRHVSPVHLETLPLIIYRNILHSDFRRTFLRYTKSQVVLHSNIHVQSLPM